MVEPVIAPPASRRAAWMIGAAVGSAALLLVTATARPLFGLTPGGALALYFIVWWTTLFAVLPFGVRSQVEVGDVTQGTEPGAPSDPALWRKAGITTLVGTAVYAVVAWSLVYVMG